MDSNEQSVRAGIVRWARSLFERGLTSGSSGNISVRLPNKIIATPTNACLGFLDPDELSETSDDGTHVSGRPPTKEMPIHLAFYRTRPDCHAVVHLHSTYATALSCLLDTPTDNALPAITPYVIMRAGRVPIVPYHRPGSADAGEEIAIAAENCSAVLIANHGPVATGNDLDSAVYAIEEIEEAAKLTFLTRDSRVRSLDQHAIEALNAAFGSARR